MSTQPKRRRTLIILTTALAVLVILLTSLALRRAHQHAQPAPEAAGTMSAGSAAQTGAPTQQGALEAGTPQEAAAEFITAYRSMSSADPRPNTWVTRAKAWATPRFGDQLSKTYTDSGGATWIDFKSASQHLHAADIKVSAFPTRSDLFMVEYQDQTVKEDHVVLSQDAVKVLTLKHTDSGWKVDTISEFGDQPHKGPVAPNDMGKEAEAGLDND